MLRTDHKFRRTAICWGVAFLWAGTPLRAQSSALVAPVRAFDIQKVWPGGGAPAGKIRQIRAAGRSLYFQVSPTFSTLDSSIVRTNRDGRVERAITLPPKSFIQEFAVDPAGTVYVLLMASGTGGQRQVVVYGPDGEVAQAVPVSHQVLALCAAGDTVLTVAATPTGLALAGVGSESSPLASVTLSRSTSRLSALSLPDGRVAAVEPTAGVVHLIDLQRASEVPVRPRVPEMQWLATLPPGNRTMNAVFGDAAVAPSGQICLLLGHYRLSEGAAVVSFHMNGNLFQTIRYKLPDFPNGSGLMAPSSMAIYEGTTMVLAGGDGKVAEYPL